MDEKSLFTNFWLKESQTTRTVLSRIPEGSDYRPDAKSRTAKEIAWQIVEEEKMLIDALEQGKFDWAPSPLPATMKEVVDAEASLRHRPSSRPDHDVPSPNGLEGTAHLRPER